MNFNKELKMCENIYIYDADTSFFDGYIYMVYFTNKLQNFYIKFAVNMQGRFTLPTLKLK